MAIWVCSDIHGSQECWDKIKKWLNSNDTLIVLGDIIDRGSAGFELFREIYNHPQTKVIMGNHEAMALDTMLEWEEDHITGEAYELWSWNGGCHTFATYKRMHPNDRKKWRTILSELPYYQYITFENNDRKFFLSHSGFMPEDLTNISKLNKYDMIWDRSHYLEFDQEIVDKKITIVHGHTPIKYLVEDLQKNNVQLADDSLSIGPLTYNGGYKIDLDMLTIKSNRVALFCLNTEETIVLHG